MVAFPGSIPGSALKMVDRPRDWANPYGDGKAHEQIVKTNSEHLQEEPTARMGDVVLYDSRAEGHHSEYVRHLVQYGAERPRLGQLHFVVPKALARYDAATVAAIRDSSHCHLHELSADEQERIDRAPLLWRSFVEWQIVQQYVRSIGADHCVLLEMNVFQLSLGFSPGMGGLDLTGILFFPYPRIEAQSDAVADRLLCWLDRARKQVQLRWMLRNRDVRTVFLLNDHASADYLNQLWPERRPFAMLPDPVPSLSEEPVDSPVREASENGEPTDRLIESDGRTTFLMFGALREEKGVRNVIEAFSQHDGETAEQARLCLFGQVRADLKAAFPSLVASLRRAQPRLDVRVENRFLSEAELEQVLQAADVVLAPYLRTEGSSGVIGLAARYGAPVIGPSSGLVGSLINEYDLGATVNASDPSAIAAAVRRFVRERAADRGTGTQRYVQERTPERFASTVFAAVRGEDH
jgi:glycosyltransferase involved in cell wall biosynthesis